MLRMRGLRHVLPRGVDLWELALGIAARAGFSIVVFVRG